MATLLTLAVTNTLIAGIIALVALLATWLARRPALAHVLWLLVLLKLITPPIWSLAIAVAIPIRERSSTLEVFQSNQHRSLLPADTSASQQHVDRDIPTFVPAPLPQRANEALLLHSSANLGAALLILWFAGSVACTLIAIIRLSRFHHILRFASPAPADVIARADALARRLGLGGSPPLLFIPASVSPMLLGGLGRPRLIIPERLWLSLEPTQQDAILLHELAHLRRRDHWVRAFELLVTVVYWWNPLMWFARRQLRIQEELCCDAWVTWAMPGGADDYAAALVEAVDFAAGLRPGLPLLASGISEFKHLQRRLHMIHNGTGTRRLGWTAIIACGALIVMPLSLTKARQQAVPVKPAVAERGSTTNPTSSATRPTPPDNETQAELDRLVPAIKWDHVPLANVLSHLQFISGLDFDVDWKSLEKAGVDRNKLVILAVRNIKFSKVLALVLFNLGDGRPDTDKPTYEVKGGVVRVFAGPQKLAEGGLPLPAAAVRPAAPNATEPAEVIDPDESPQDRLARRHLDRSIAHLRFDKLPLSRAIEEIRPEIDAPIFVNWAALKQANVTRDTPVTLNVQDVTIAKALSYILNSAGEGTARLGFGIEDGVIMITTEGELAKNTLTRVYDVRDFLINVAGDERARAVAALIRSITHNVDDLSWRDNGGTAGTIRELQGQLIIAQTQENQRRIAEFFDRRRKAGGMPAVQREFPLIKP